MPSVERMTTTATLAHTAQPQRVGFLRQLGVDTGYILLGFPLAIASFSALVAGLSAGLGTLVIVVGLPILAGVLLTRVAEMRQTITVLTEQKAAAASAETTALRRLERDIHDGPQQRLVRLSMDLSRARQQLDSDPDALRDSLDEAISQTQETLDELRALSRGIALPVLTDRGLPSALAALAVRCTVPVELDVDPELGTPGGRLDAAVETTAYFAVAEALTNVAKHSGAANCRVTVAHGPGRVGVEIVDDGDGGAVGTARRWCRPPRNTGRTSRWWTSGCRRHTPMRDCVLRSRPAHGCPARRCLCCPSMSRRRTPTTCSPTDRARSVIY